LTRRRGAVLLLAGAPLLAFAGCAAPDPAREAREREAAEAAERAASRRYLRSWDAVWDALLASAAERRLAIVRQSREAGELDLRAGMSGLSAGERVSVRLAREGDGSIRVEIRSRPVVEFSLPVDWQRVLFGDLEQRLAPRRGS
jgi:hypothetical protein